MPRPCLGLVRGTHLGQRSPCRITGRTHDRRRTACRTQQQTPCTRGVVHTCNMLAATQLAGAHSARPKCRGLEDRGRAVKQRTGPEGSRVGYGRSGAVQLFQRDAEPLIVGARAVAQVAQGDRLAQLDRGVGVAAPMDTRVDAVPEADVAGELVQLAVDRQRRLPRWSSVRDNRRPVVRRRERGRRGDFRRSVKKELQDGDARARDRAMPGRVGRVRWRALRERLR